MSTAVRKGKGGGPTAAQKAQSKARAHAKAIEAEAIKAIRRSGAAGARRYGAGQQLLARLKTGEWVRAEVLPSEEGTAHTSWCSHTLRVIARDHGRGHADGDTSKDGDDDDDDEAARALRRTPSLASSDLGDELPLALHPWNHAPLEMPLRRFCELARRY